MNDTKNFVFLPGWGFSSEVFYPFAKKLTGTLTFLELPLLSDYENLDVVVTKLAKTIRTNSTIIGWSLGGLIALKLCALFPKKCTELILIATTPRFTQDAHWQGIEPLITTQFFNMFHNCINSLMRRFINLTNYPNKKINIKQFMQSHHILSKETYNKESLLCYLKLLFHTDLREEYSTITIPTLHLLGDKEGIVSTNDKQLKQLNPNVNISRIKDSGHMLFLTHSNECKDRIKQILL